MRACEHWWVYRGLKWERQQQMHKSLCFQSLQSKEKSGMGEVNRIWCNAIGRTLHHFAMSCSKSGTGSLQVFLGLLLMFLYLLVLVSTWTYYFVCQPILRFFEDIQSDPRLEELSARLKEKHWGCTWPVGMPDIKSREHAGTSHALSRERCQPLFEWKAKQNTDVPNHITDERSKESAPSFALCSRRRGKLMLQVSALYFVHLCTSL